MKITAVFAPNSSGNPTGKLADGELRFEDAGPLSGLKLIGFAIWERRTGSGRNVTFPARSYSVNGERRSFALLRPINDVTTHERLRESILNAFEYVEDMAALKDGDGSGDSNECVIWDSTDTVEALRRP